VLLKAPQVVVPEPFVVRDPVAHGSETLGHEAVPALSAAPLLGHESGVEEDAEVLGHGRAAHLEVAGERLYGTLAVGEEVEDPAARWMADGPEHLRLLASRFHSAIMRKKTLTCQEDPTSSGVEEAMTNQVRAFLAISLDGFIAGPDDELDWLGGHGEGGSEDTFTPFFAEIGAMLMGRRTFDVVSRLGGDWPYGETPVLVATSRLLEPGRSSVRGVHGPIGEMIAEAQRAAGDRDVYVDGGALFRSVLEADLIDELTLTVIPVVLGAGIPLFAGAGRRKVGLVSAREIGAGMVQLRYRLDEALTRVHGGR
jgi:dihydrofolate reductase